MGIRINNIEMIKEQVLPRKTEIAYKAGCSVSLIEKLASRVTAPREKISRAIAEVLEVDHEELFPWVEQYSCQKAS